VNSSFVALAFISVIVSVGAFIGLYAGTRRKMDLEQWTVGDRGFGMLLVWLLMAGEVYTTFTFLGASGWAYSKGAPVLYVLGYQPLMYVVSFFILPQVWEVGRKYRLQTQADFFHVRYNNKYLAAFVALVGIIFIVPYLQLQLMGLGMIVEVASYGAIHRTPAMIISFVIVAAFVLTSGIRGVAWVSVLKDLLLLFSAVFVSLAIPYIYFGGIGRMFAELARVKPAHLVMPGATTNLGHSWYISTVVLVAVGFYMWPQFFGASFSAKSSDTLRRNAVVTPWTQKITWVLSTKGGEFGRWRSARSGTVFCLRDRDGMANGNALRIDQNFLDQQAQNLLSLTNIQRLRACVQFFPKCA